MVQNGLSNGLIWTDLIFIFVQKFYNEASNDRYP
jgi:hypothetical protein